MAQAEPEKSLDFVVPGEPIGYVAKPNFKQSRRIAVYAEKARLYAKRAGLILPLTATKESPVMVHVKCFFSKGVRCDPGNAQKLWTDLLFYKSKGGDRWTGGTFCPPFFDEKEPRVIVTVDWWDMKTFQENFG